jgi:hypothetical protein
MLVLGIILLAVSCFVGSGAYIIFRHTGAKNAGLIGNLSVLGMICGLVLLFIVEWWAGLLAIAGYLVGAMFFTMFWNGIIVRNQFPRDFLPSNPNGTDRFANDLEDAAQQIMQECNRQHGSAADSTRSAQSVPPGKPITGTGARSAA